MAAWMCEKPSPAFEALQTEERAGSHRETSSGCRCHRTTPFGPSLKPRHGLHRSCCSAASSDHAGGTRLISRRVIQLKLTLDDLISGPIEC